MNATKPKWDYDDDDQTIPHRAAYLARLAELEAAGEYPYNDSFRGHIGYDGPSEDSMIYQLQSWKAREEHAAKLDALRAEGFRPLKADEITDTPRKYAAVIEHGYYMGGTGIRRYDDARLLKSGCRSVFLIPKGNRTHGHHLGANVLVLP